MSECDPSAAGACAAERLRWLVEQDPEVLPVDTKTSLFEYDSGKYRVAGRGMSFDAM